MHMERPPLHMLPRACSALSRHGRHHGAFYKSRSSGWRSAAPWNDRIRRSGEWHLHGRKRRHRHRRHPVDRPARRWRSALVTSIRGGTMPPPRAGGRSCCRARHRRPLFRRLPCPFFQRRYQSDRISRWGSHRL